MPGPPASPVLDAASAAFVEGGVSIGLGSRSIDNVPTLSFAVGCRVSADRRRVTVFVPASQSRVLLENIATTRQVAAVFSQPSTHRTLQIKADDASIAALGEDDLERIRRHLDDLEKDLASVGYEPSFTRTLFASDPADLVAVTFTASAAFESTPGPQAGMPLARPAPTETRP